MLSLCVQTHVYESLCTPPWTSYSHISPSLVTQQINQVIRLVVLASTPIPAHVIHHTLIQHIPSILYMPTIHIIVQGIMQQEQSSPHQQGSLTGGFEMGPLAIDDVGEPEEVAEVVEGGMVGDERGYTSVEAL